MNDEIEIEDEDVLLEERRRHHYRLTYAGGVEVTVWAESAGAAVLLAGQGTPEQITDLNVLNEMETRS